MGGSGFHSCAIFLMESFVSGFQSKIVSNRIPSEHVLSPLSEKLLSLYAIKIPCLMGAAILTAPPMAPSWRT